MASDMRVDPQRAAQLAENLALVARKVDAASKSSRKVRIIAVSKLKPATDILALHAPSQHLPSSYNQQSQPPASHYHFGENYVQELQAKSKILPPSIRWHFIGALQTNKCKSLAESVPSLWCVESVDTAKKADALNKGREIANKSGTASEGKAEGEEEMVEEEQEKRLRVMVQVNTSGEAEKSGCEPGDPTTALCRHIRESCPALRLQGLMTIGAIARSKAATSENEDFRVLTETRDKVCAELGLRKEELELSMGMSADYEVAIGMGSDEVRIGSTIFGERPARQDAKILENDEPAGAQTA